MLKKIAEYEEESSCAKCKDEKREEGLDKAEGRYCTVSNGDGQMAWIVCIYIYIYNIYTNIAFPAILRTRWGLLRLVPIIH